MLASTIYTYQREAEHKFKIPLFVMELSAKGEWFLVGNVIDIRGIPKIGSSLRVVIVLLIGSGFWQYAINPRYVVRGYR